MGRLWGVGEKTRDLLSRLAIRTVGDLARTPRPVLERLLGEAAARHLGDLAHGIDERDVVPYEAPKSVGHEETFERDLDDLDEILRELLHLSGKVAARLREDGYRARTVTLKARLASFTTPHEVQDPLGRNRSRYRPVPRGGAALPRAARRAAAGSGSSGSRPAGSSRPARSSWRCCAGERWGEVERTLDRIEERFGRGAATQAVLLDRDRSSPAVAGLPTILKTSATLGPQGRPHDRRLRMPLNDHEQRILDEIERRLAEDDPSFVEQVGRTDLYTHLARRIRVSAFTFVVGLLLLFFFAASVWFAVIGFGLMLASAVADLPLPRAARVATSSARCRTRAACRSPV